jgi:hypothetical protein
VKDVGSYAFSSVILKCFLGVDKIDEKVNDQHFATFFIGLLVRISNASLSLPVMLLGEFAYKLNLS